MDFAAGTSKPTKDEITHMLHAFNANSFKPHFEKVKKKSNGFDGGGFLIDEKCQYYDALGHMVVKMHKKTTSRSKNCFVFKFSDCFETHVFTAADSLGIIYEMQMTADDQIYCLVVIKALIKRSLATVRRLMQ